MQVLGLSTQVAAFCQQSARQPRTTVRMMQRVGLPINTLAGCFVKWLSEETPAPPSPSHERGALGHHLVFGPARTLGDGTCSVSLSLACRGKAAANLFRQAPSISCRVFFFSRLHPSTRTKKKKKKKNHQHPKWKIFSSQKHLQSLSFVIAFTPSHTHHLPTFAAIQAYNDGCRRWHHKNPQQVHHTDLERWLRVRRAQGGRNGQPYH